ncbi:PREDICTED: uncharacterized protein LOC107064047 isoform X2 [Polistes dominula]|uniref:Uncharacterized protein LOC107064047 isoform X2 n=1 Tax=Polistes dominula TaxID=743375 RepID=A0ABM1HUZ8_POLDO|nr:PREDICTED: uncharacterized protein LOC107064047 isoform X2 [Polistes dominula]
MMVLYLVIIVDINQDWVDITPLAQVDPLRYRQDHGLVVMVQHRIIFNTENIGNNKDILTCISNNIKVVMVTIINHLKVIITDINKGMATRIDMAVIAEEIADGDDK